MDDGVPHSRVGDPSAPLGWRLYHAAMHEDTSSYGVMPRGPDRGLDEFRELIRAAFEQARNSGKRDWSEMTAAVLKNRILDMTGREFSEDRYGSPSFIHLVRRVPDLLEIVNARPPTLLRLRANVTTPSDILTSDNA